MANSTGLYLRGEIWHIDKTIFGRHVRKSTRTSNREEAELILSGLIQAHRKTELFGERPEIRFSVAASKHLKVNQHKRSLDDDEDHINLINPYIGNMALHLVNNNALEQFVEDRQKAGRANATINHTLKVVRRILNQSANDWFVDGSNLTWLDSAPQIKMLPLKPIRKPRPLSAQEQVRLISELPRHLAEMALFKVNTGCREAEVCGLLWDWEFDVPELKDTTVFVIPGGLTKNGLDRLVVLNSVARGVIESRRNMHDTHVFTYKDNPLVRMNNSAWRKAIRRAKLPIRVHDLKHTFGRRLRAAGVCFEDRQDLLAHKSSRITTHYSSAEIGNLINASEAAVANMSAPELTMIKRNSAVKMVKFNTKSPQKPQNQVLGTLCNEVNG
jgi:integrase